MGEASCYGLQDLGSIGMKPGPPAVWSPNFPAARILNSQTTSTPNKLLSYGFSLNSLGTCDLRISFHFMTVQFKVPPSEAPAPGGFILRYHESFWFYSSNIIFSTIMKACVNIILVGFSFSVK